MDSIVRSAASSGAPASLPALTNMHKATTNTHATSDENAIPGPPASLPALYNIHKATTSTHTTSDDDITPRGWYSRRYLPHFDQPGLLQSITFRLYDAVPSSLIQEWKAELACGKRLPASDPLPIELRNRINRYEDSHHGACWLLQPPIAQIVENTLLHFDGQRYELHAWCIMPNHVHAMLRAMEGWNLDSILHTWKSYSAQRVNKYLRRKGQFWFREYHDRIIRNQQHYVIALAYIEGNPVKAGLVDRPEDWRFSSAHRELEVGPAGAPLSGAPASLPALEKACNGEEAGRDAGAPGGDTPHSSG